MSPQANGKPKLDYEQVADGQYFVYTRGRIYCVSHDPVSRDWLVYPAGGDGSTVASHLDPLLHRTPAGGPEAAFQWIADQPGGKQRTAR